MFETSIQAGMLSVLCLGVAWPQEPGGGEPVQGEYALALELYGQIDEPVGQALRPSLEILDGVPHLVVEGGESFDPAYLVVGSREAAIEMPWGDRIQVLPELVVPIGSFDHEGRLTVAIPLGPEDVIDNPLHVQVIEQLYIDPYPWEWQSSPGIRWIAVEEEASSGGGPEPIDGVRPDDDLDVEVALLVIDEVSGARYEVWLEAWAPHGGHRLVIDEVAAEDTGITYVRCGLISGDPEPGDEAPRRIRLRVPVASAPADRIEVSLARRREGVYYFIPPPHVLLRTFWFGGSGIPSDRGN